MGVGPSLDRRSASRRPYSASGLTSSGRAPTVPSRAEAELSLLLRYCKSPRSPLRCRPHLGHRPAKASRQTLLARYPCTDATPCVVALSATHEVSESVPACPVHPP